MSPERIADQRIALARRLLEVPDPAWPAVRQAVQEALDPPPELGEGP
jgi:hypothetical protein